MFHNYWKPANGIDLQAETEFYFGKVEVGTQLSFIKAQKIRQSDYKSAQMYIGWGWEQKILDMLHLYSGFQLSHYFMYFDDDYTEINLESESEFGFGLKASLKYNFSNNLFVNISGRYQIIYTHHRIYQSFISFGLGKSFDTPKWLWEFLN